MEDNERYDRLDENDGGRAREVKRRQSGVPIGISEKGKCVMLKDVLDRVISRVYSNSLEDVLWLEEKLNFVKLFPEGAYYSYSEINHYTDKQKKVLITKEMLVKEITQKLKHVKRRLKGQEITGESES